MNLHKAKKMIFKMQGCFAKLKLNMVSEKDVLDNDAVPPHLEFSAQVTIGLLNYERLSAKYYPALKMIELSLYFNPKYEEYKRQSIIHLLNYINLARSEAHWALCDCCNEIELRSATIIKDILSEKYFMQMVKKIIYLGRIFFPLIQKQITNSHDPYELASEFFAENKKLLLPQFCGIPEMYVEEQTKINII